MNNSKPVRRFSGGKKKSPAKGNFKRKNEHSDKPYSKNSDNFRSDKDKPFGENKFKKSSFSGEKRKFADKYVKRSAKSFSKDRPEREYGTYNKDADKEGKPKFPFKKNPEEKRFDRKNRFYKKDFSKKKPEKPTYADQGLTRLNKYIANAGICSRREADDLIKSGCVTVNGKTISELGFKVKEGDVVNYSGANLKAEKHVYLLLNKPKDYITTADDERGRRTVMELIQGACKERIYPVGRLDRNTTGLLLFTNDGEMTKKLTHPKHKVQKLYHVELDKNLKQTDLLKIREGLELEDGFIKPDEVSYVGKTKSEVGIEIHSGANRIVRRIFESLGYEVVKLDRVMLAGLTKKNLQKGRWRLLSEQEIAFLKMV